MIGIVGYTFDAEDYCPRCIIKVLPTGSGESYDGWALASGAFMTAEANLDEIAAAFGINRSDEHSFDSADFPKIVTAQMMSSNGSDPDAYRCGACHEMLLDL